MCDENFLALIESEVSLFLEKTTVKRQRPSTDILLFPPLRSVYRFNIHQLIEEFFPNLQTVSVGLEDSRRTVVYPRRNRSIMSQQQQKPAENSASTTDAVLNVPASNGSSKRTVKPSLQPYVPPALRNRDATSSPNPISGRLESDRSPSTSSRKSEKKGKTAVKSRTAVIRGTANKSLNTNLGRAETVVPVGADEIGGTDMDNLGAAETSANSASDAAVLPQLPVAAKENLLQGGDQPNDKSPTPTCSAFPIPRRPGRVVIRADSEDMVNLITSGTSPNPAEPAKLSPGIIKVPHLAASGSSSPEIAWTRKCPPSPPTPKTTPESLQHKHRLIELGKDDKNTNWVRRSRSPPECVDLSEKSSVGPSITVLKSKTTQKTPVTTDVLLSDQILDELTTAFGEDLSVHHATQSYRSYAPICFDGPEGRNYLHVVEAYEFPSTYSTGDLTRELQMLTEEFIEIRWVDDTHALCLFPNETAAKQAMSLRSPLGKLKLRPLSEASDQSRKKAQSCAQMDSLSMAKERPETNAATARRMVASALGLKIAVPKEKREQEREQLNVAKEKKVQAVEKKVQAVKKKEDIWEGRV